MNKYILSLCLMVCAGVAVANYKTQNTLNVMFKELEDAGFSLSKSEKRDILASFIETSNFDKQKFSQILFEEVKGFENQVRFIISPENACSLKIGNRFGHTIPSSLNSKECHKLREVCYKNESVRYWDLAGKYASGSRYELINRVIEKYRLPRN